MTKVNVHVQILITGPIASGKTVVMREIRKTLSKIVSNEITQTDTFETSCADGSTFRVEGELIKQAEMKSPPISYSSVPGYPDTDKMLDYLVYKIEQNKKLLNEAYGPIASKPSETHSHVLSEGTTLNEFKPFKIAIGKNGTIREFDGSIPYNSQWRVVTILQAVKHDTPVGMHQPEAKTSQAQPAEATQPKSARGLTRFNILLGGVIGKSHHGEFVRFDEVEKKCILLTPVELQSNYDRVKWAEGLIRQLPETHEGRNSWLKNYSAVYACEQNPTERKLYETLDEHRGRLGLSPVQILDYVGNKQAPKPDAHTKADKTLALLRPESKARFNFNDANPSPVYPGGLTVGSRVQVITTNGNILNGGVRDFHWTHSALGPVVVYWRRID